MPKSKKKKKQDFQKVKLKVGKKLPKGDNVTNLSFKSRQIHLTQKIKDDEGGDVVTKKKLNIQDLLRQCDHHSSSNRVNAVSGLKELWLNNYDELMVSTNLFGFGAIVKKLSAMLIDNEAVVRHTVINLLKMLLHKVAKEKLNNGQSLDGSLFTHIHTFLCCAMNHIHEDIKLDALLVFDTLLDTFPHLMVQQTGDLLKNLMGLISSPAYLGAKADSTVQRLSMNPDSKLPAMKFRASVLLRMKKIFMVALRDPSGFGQDKIATGSSQSANLSRVWSVYDDRKASPSRQKSWLQSRFCEQKFGLIFQSGGLDMQDHIMDAKGLEMFFHFAIPILLQCWKEAYASFESDSDNMLMADSVEVMTHLICIIQHMLVLYTSHGNSSPLLESSDKCKAELESVSRSFLGDFEKSFMTYFPYSDPLETTTTTNKKKRKKTKLIDKATLQAHVSALNLGICEIICSFCVNSDIAVNTKCMKKIGKHLAKLLRHPHINSDQTRVVVRCLGKVFWNQRCRAIVADIYETAFEHFKSSTVKSFQKKELYNLFAFMVRTWKGWNNNTVNNPELFEESNGPEDSKITKVLEKFIQIIPTLLLALHTSSHDLTWLLDVLQLTCHGSVQRRSSTFHLAFKEKLSDILDPESGLFSARNEEVQQRLCFLLSMATPLSRESLKQLLNALRRPAFSPYICRRKSWSCVSHILHNIFSNIRGSIPLTAQEDFHAMTSVEKSQLSNFLRFLFSLLLAFTGEELETLCPKNGDDSAEEKWMKILLSLDGDQLERHLEIAKIASMEIVNFCIPAELSKGYFSVTFIHNIELLWTQTFENRPFIHVLSVFGLLHFLRQCCHRHIAHEIGKPILNLAAFAVCAVLTGLFSKENSNFGNVAGGLTDKTTWIIKAELISLLKPAGTDGWHMLHFVMELLQRRTNGAFDANEDEKQSAKIAQDFLLSDETIKSKLDR